MCTSLAVEANSEAALPSAATTAGMLLVSSLAAQQSLALESISSMQHESALQAACARLQADLTEATECLTAANREAERSAVQGAAEQQSRDAAALQARTQQVAAVREQADRWALAASTCLHPHPDARLNGRQPVQSLRPLFMLLSQMLQTAAMQHACCLRTFP